MANLPIDNFYFGCFIYLFKENNYKISFFLNIRLKTTDGLV